MMAQFFGRPLKEALRHLARREENEICWDTGGYSEMTGVAMFLGFPKSVVAADGERVLLRNPQMDKRVGRPTLERRARHLFMASEAEHDIDPQRARYMPNIPQCLDLAQFILKDPETGNFVYGARFPSNRIHLVITKPNAAPRGPDAVSRFLITHFVFDGGGKQRHFPIIWIRPGLCPPTTPV